MRLPLSWLRDFVPVSVSPEDLAERCASTPYRLHRHRPLDSRLLFPDQQDCQYVEESFGEYNADGPKRNDVKREEVLPEGSLIRLLEREQASSFGVPVRSEAGGLCV